jgi:hypothetical protein
VRLVEVKAVNSVLHLVVLLVEMKVEQLVVSKVGMLVVV